MTSDEAWKEFETLPPDEKKNYSSFNDYLAASGQCVCEVCDKVVEYDEVDENGDCFDCAEDEEDEDEE